MFRSVAVTIRCGGGGALERVVVRPTSVAASACRVPRVPRVPRVIPRRLLSTKDAGAGGQTSLVVKAAAKGTTGATSGVVVPSYLNWPPMSMIYRASQYRVVRIPLRYGRIVILCITLYGVGYQSGIHDYVRDPKAFDKQFIMSALTSMNTTGVEFETDHKGRSLFVETPTEENPKPKPSEGNASEDMRRVKEVGGRLIQAAKKHVRSLLIELDPKKCTLHTGDAITLTNGSMVTNGTVVGPSKGGGWTVEVDGRKVSGVRRDQIEKPKSQDEVAQFEKLMESYKLLSQRWQFILYQSKAPNAFVHGMLPRRIFVANGLLNPSMLCANDDELAMVLAHELAHTILDHTGHTLETAYMVAAIQLVLLTALDPTGFLIFLFEILGMGWITRHGITLPTSRCHESEADAMGLTIAAKACYSPEKAIAFFDRLYEFEEKFVKHHHKSFGHDHPATQERSEAMHEAVEQAQECYSRSSCAGAMDSFKKAGGGGALGWFKAMSK